MRLSRTRLLPRFVESVGDHRASLGDVGSGRGEAFEQSSIAFPGETPLTAATGRPIPDAAHLFIEGAKSIQVARQAVVRARATRSPASDGSCCKLLRVSTLLAFHEALEVARARSLAQLAQRLGSICRTRSRVTANCLPTSSRVQSAFCPMPKRMRRICSSRGVSVANTLRLCFARVSGVAKLLSGGWEPFDCRRNSEPTGSLQRTVCRCKRRESGPLDSCVRHWRMPSRRWSGWIASASQIVSKANGP